MVDSVRKIIQPQALRGGAGFKEDPPPPEHGVPFLLYLFYHLYYTRLIFVFFSWASLLKP